MHHCILLLHGKVLGTHLRGARCGEGFDRERYEQCVSSIRWQIPARKSDMKRREIYMMFMEEILKDVDISPS